MPEIKISQLSTLAEMTDAAVVPVVEGSETKKITGLALKRHIGNANIVPTQDDTFSLGNTGNVWNRIHANVIDASGIVVENSINANVIVSDTLVVNSNVSANTVTSESISVDSSIITDTIISNSIISNDGASLAATSNNQVIIERDNGTSLRFRGKNLDDDNVITYAGIFSNEVYGATPATKTRLLIGSNENASLELQTSNEMRISAVDDNTGGGKVRIASGNGSGTPHAIEFHPGTEAEVDNLVAKIDNDGLQVTGNTTVSEELSALILKTSPVLFNELANASVAGAGARAFISDADDVAFGSVVGGGGANSMPVFSNGTNWLIG